MALPWVIAGIAAYGMYKSGQESRRANRIYGQIAGTAMEQAELAGQELDALMSDIPEYKIPEQFQQNIDLAQTQLDEYGKPLAISEEMYKQGISASEQAQQDRELSRLAQTDITSRQAMGQRTFGGNLDKYNQMRSAMSVQREKAKVKGFATHLETLRGRNALTSNLMSARNQMATQQIAKQAWETLDPWAYKRDLAAGAGASAWEAYYGLQGQRAGAAQSAANAYMGITGEVLGGNLSGGGDFGLG